MTGIPSRSPIPVVINSPSSQWLDSSFWQHPSAMVRTRQQARKSVPDPATAQLYPAPVNGNSTLDISNLKLDVERIQFRWNAEESRYYSSPDSEDSNKPGDETPHYTPNYAFAIARTFTPTETPNAFNVTKRIHAWSPQFLKGARAVLEGFSNTAWGAKPLQLDPEEMLKYLPNFNEYIRSLEAQKELEKEEQDTHEVLEQLKFFVDLLRKEYASKLETLANLLAEDQVTFDYAWGVFIPGSTIIAHCSITGEPLAVRLISCNLMNTPFERYWALSCDYVDSDGNGLPGLARTTIKISEFAGAEDIIDLPAFPMKPYLDDTRRSELCASLTRRGRRYWELARTWCHKDYDAVAYLCSGKKIAIKSRIMLDRPRYAQYSMSPQPPSVDRDLDGNTLIRKALSGKNDTRRAEISDEEFMLMPAKMYGFSLADRKWLIFNVETVKDIQWNLEAFDNLDIQADKKDIVKTLILSHTQRASEFDDFVSGKGRGLIFALHGTPGVGKTLTAEATSEVARAPLYMVGAGDLGTTANELDSALTTVFALASEWKAIVLIDEADVFLEKRDLHDLVRNAMVAVFLRQLEYYTGILILTTNRLSIIDGAMKSRIHVSLHYEPLSLEIRERLWKAFLRKAGVHDGTNEVDTELMKELCQQSLNGREIKNVIKTATTYAAYHGRTVTIHDILRVVHVIDDMADIE
ncbi:hypothetical protein NM688_g5851 [Phlebia brevispora]|uniref:Uncharacterized protein n=1 Tax=Phlebia brevispora TaxID=194682 RepID=A0ACC1SNU0_9APHY|nr:hypothetical protein NM688_g5851 [Phlebia brevispora]